MLDGMTKIKTSEILKELKDYTEDLPHYSSDEVLEALDMAIKALEKQRWIPVSERLPEESLGSVLGWDKYRERCVFVQYIDNHFQITGKDETFNIIAWMPLPTPYKEGEE